jgi:starch synthase
VNILMVASEAVPFAKTGGLADVCGALPAELAALGHEVSLVLPAYPSALRAGLPIDDMGLELTVPIGAKSVSGRLLRSHLPGSNVPVFLVQQPAYFDRAGPYGENGEDYVDNCERFTFFCRAAIEAVRLLELRPDVLHCHDWQTGLLPAFHKIELRGVPPFDQLSTVMTIHNLAYQGQFWHWDMLLTGLDWKYFNWQQMEFFGHLNLMKTGLVFADALTTVSPRYALEIQTPEFGCGLDGVLQQRRGALTGIINGVDYRQWDPAIDPHLPARYDASTWRAGKAACKAALQEELGLAASPDAPLVAFIGRLAEQKGIDLLAPVIQRGEPAEVQWVVLGTGEPKYQQSLARLAAERPKQVAVRLEFSDRLAHRIEAAADMFAMPSRFEPCGLNQLYSLRYGTPPIVRNVGGLANTIVDATEENLAAGTATGFVAPEHTAAALAAALRRAVDLHRQPEAWGRLVATGMRQDWSWARSAREYVALYEDVRSAARPTAAVR